MKIPRKHDKLNRRKIQKKRLFLMGSAVAMSILLLASITLVAHFTAKPAEADNTTYLVVYHSNIYGTNVATSGTVSMTVEARQWPGGSWTDITNTAQSEYTCNEGTRAWKYNTDISGAAIEFRVTIEGGKTGTKCGGGSTSYVDDDVLNKIVSQGGTASITAGWYYP